MSVDVTFYVGPDPAVRLDREQVLAFVGDLVGHRVVAGPWTILSGAVDPQDPLGMVTLASGMGGLCVVSVAKGDDPSELVSALANVYQEDKNLCVCLEGLDFRNPELKALSRMPATTMVLWSSSFWTGSSGWRCSTPTGILNTRISNCANSLPWTGRWHSRS